MKSVSVERLTREAFSPFGSIQEVTCLGCDVIGGPPIEFFRDLVVQSTSSPGIAWSICRAGQRPYLIDTAEFHSATAEGLMPLNGDMLFFVAPATPPNDPFPAAGVRVFRVPQYTSLIIRPGVWHHAPFIVGEGTLNVLVTLPERTYANDCYVTHLSVNEQIEISFTQ